MMNFKKLRYMKKILFFIVLNLILGTNLPIFASVTLAKYLEPNNAFELLMPKNWKVTPFEYFGEKQYFFTAATLDVKEFVENGIDIESIFWIKLNRIETSYSKKPFSVIVQNYIKFRKNLYKKHGAVVKVKIGKHRIINGHDFVEIFLNQRGEKTLILFGVKLNYAYELAYDYKKNKEKKWKPIFEQMLKSFKFLAPSNKEELKTFSSMDESISIDLPVDWFLYENYYPKSLNIYISRESNIVGQKHFQVGVKIFKIFNGLDWLSIHHSITNVKLFSIFLNSLIESKIKQETYSFEVLDISNCKFVFLEKSLMLDKYKYYVQRIDLFTVTENGKIYHFIFEAPVMEFEKYRPIFEKAINSIKIKE